MLEVLHRVHPSALLYLTPAGSYGECQAKKRVSLVAHEACPLNK